MTVPTGTFQVYTQVNIREDLINAIYNVDPFKTPFLNMSRKAEANQTNHEWNIDALAAQNLSNAAVEGDNPTNVTITPTVRRGNITQISTKTVQLSGTTQAVVAAGGSNKMGYQLLQRSKELKRDMEGILLQNQAKVVGSAAVARKTAGVPSWLLTNTVFQTGGAPSGANPGTSDGTATRVYNGTKVTVTEAMVKSMLQKVFSASGDCPEYMLVSPTNKQNISAFAGPGTRFIEVQDKRLKTAVDIYESDFGAVKIVPDIFIANSNDIFAFNPQFVRVAYLRPFQTIPLAKTGDSDQKMLIVEYGLEMGNEKAHGAIFDTNG
jgi:Family of unknown function (DUF5309)